GYTTRVSKPGFFSWITVAEPVRETEVARSDQLEAVLRPGSRENLTGEAVEQDTIELEETDTENANLNVRRSVQDETVGLQRDENPNSLLQPSQ
uniref:hypothetical protein n=1 Tax=Candidatus Entotheonella palauensis TaxID=93172 RepID=UPI0015C42D4C